jgi:hypothetical protein
MEGFEDEGNFVFFFERPVWEKSTQHFSSLVNVNKYVAFTVF